MAETTINGETPAEWMARLGMDGHKWAAEFRKTARSLGYADMDEGWLIGWFCNAIMVGFDEASRRSRRSRAELAAAKAETEAERRQAQKWLAASRSVTDGTMDELGAALAELAAARERADTLHAALDEAVDLLHGLEEPAWSGIGGSATVDRLSDLVDRLAAPTSAAHTGEGGEHGTD